MRAQRPGQRGAGEVHDTKEASDDGERCDVEVGSLAPPLLDDDIDAVARACGRMLLRLREIEGRSEDVIRLGGVVVHPTQFATLSSDPDVLVFQVVQQGERLRIRLVLRTGANGAATRLKVALAERLRKAGVARPAIDFEVVERLERPPGGKLALVVADRSLRGTVSGRAAHEPGARAQRERAAG